MGAAAGAVAAVAHLAHELGRQTQQLADHDRRIAALEGHYTHIVKLLDALRTLIIGESPT